MDDPSLPAEPTVANQEEPRSKRREIWSTVAILITALLTAVFIINFVFRSYQVEGASMETTLQHSDKLIIWKLPRTWSNITGNPYLPDRGEIIVFNQHGLSQFGQEDSKQIIKRVIGLPGERVVIRDGLVTVYNTASPGGFDPDGSQPYARHIKVTTGTRDVTLGADELFVLGDNRGDSLDSRSFGPIKAQQIVGELVLRVFPVDKAKPF